MNINKWFFKDFTQDISNLRFLRTIPFCTFSDLKDNNYDLIAKLLDKINLDKNTLISIGIHQAPFGFTINPEDDRDLNVLLNSCKYSFIFTKRQDETNYLLKLILAGVIPICDSSHIFCKRLGLMSFATDCRRYERVLDKMCEIKYHQHIFNYRIALLSWKARNQWKKWQEK